MLRRTLFPTLAAASAMALTALVAGTADAREPLPGTHAGPPYAFKTEIIGGFVEPLKDQVVLERSPHGYRFRSGQQNSHLVVTIDRGLIRFADKGTKTIKRLAASCKRVKVRVGVAAVCKIPAGTSVRRPTMLEIWPRLGDDFSDTSALPASFAVTVLADKGQDVAIFGPGRDFFNGYKGRDRIWGGAGNDWIRSGLGNDKVVAGPGNDDVVSVDGRDHVHGGLGADRIWSGGGNDRLWGGAGGDLLACGSGLDGALIDAGDRGIGTCESLSRG